MSPSLADAIAAGPVVLDGGLATQLEADGADVSGALWSARLLRDDPAAIVRAHTAFYAAGARVATTASYQATYDGFAAAGIDAAGTTRLLRRSVELAREAQSTGASAPTWVAGSVGPYGAMLADGSEYRGDYDRIGVAALRRFHRPRLEVLAEAGVDVLACETVPCLAEAEALAEEIAVLGVPAWLSLTVDGLRTRRGEPVAEAFALARGVDAVIAVGVNCSEPAGLDEVVTLAAEVSGKPAVAYPNSGETWDASRRSWAGEAHFATGAVASWVRSGARLVGGCCRVGPAQVSAIGAALTTRGLTPP